MTDILVLEIEKKLICSSIEKKFKSASKFYGEFDDVVVTIIKSDLFAYLIYAIDHYKQYKIEINSSQLNTFGLNRLINNFKEHKPELSFILLGVGKNIKLIKIREKNVKKRR